MDSGDTRDLLFDDVKQVLTNEDFCDIRPLGKGAFGEVLSAISPNKKHVAIKIIKNKDAWHIEETVWPVLRHRNILPLIKIINVESMNLNLYVMPKIPYVLNKVLRTRRFRADNNGLVKVKQWSVDSLSGLQYLHKEGWAHTDIKTDNILIASDGRALLCDFSGLTHTGEPLKRLCAPLVYRPPEYYDPARRKNIEGVACDVWLFGMMCFNVLTGNWPRHMMKPVTDTRSWKTNVEPLVLEALQKTPFCMLMKRAFPAVSFTEDELHLAHDFVMSMMKWNQNDRPSVQKIKSHPFLSNLTERKEKSTEKSSPKDQRNVVTNPFPEGLKNSKMEVKKQCVKKMPITECADIKTSSSYHAENVVIFEKNNLLPDLQKSKERKNYLTNPFLNHHIDIETEIKKCNNHVPEMCNLEQKAIIGKSYEYHCKKYEDDHILPVVQASSEGKNNVTNPFVKECVSSKTKNENVTRQLPEVAVNMEMVVKDKVSPLQLPNDVLDTFPESGKNLPGRIKDWFKKKWNRTFQKSNKYKKLKEESE